MAERSLIAAARRELRRSRCNPSAKHIRVFLLIATNCGCWSHGGLEESIEDAWQCGPWPMPEVA
jgi:hypothetical protein